MCRWSECNLVESTAVSRPRESKKRAGLWKDWNQAEKKFVENEFEERARELGE